MHQKLPVFSSIFYQFFPECPQLLHVGWHGVGREGAAEPLLPLLSTASDQFLLQVALVSGRLV